MSDRLTVIVFAASISGCAGLPPSQSIPPSVPVAWSQKPEETGQLPVGTVILVEPWIGPGRPTAPGVLMDEVEGLAVFTAGALISFVAAPFVAAAHMTMPEDTVENSRTSGGNVFRHTVRLKGTNLEIVRDEYWRFEVGDCVALRTTPEMLVPALPGPCD